MSTKNSQPPDSDLDQLEAEAMAIIVQSTRIDPQKGALLFSGGKDSATVLHLAVKAFYPDPPPFVALHVDTGHNFAEVISFRDHTMKKLGMPLVVASVEESMAKYHLTDDSDRLPNRNRLQSITLKDCIAKLDLKFLSGGARRDEEKARAKERIFSLRSADGAWNPHRQRPEPWDLLNPFLPKESHFRVFPLSHWTELDIWRYIQREKIALPSIYFAHERRCLVNDTGLILSAAPWIKARPQDQIKNMKVRCRTVGDISCTALMESQAATVDEIVRELELSDLSERSLRVDDRFSSSAMEDRKKEGYF